jgi:hypothetical protein
MPHRDQSIDFIPWMMTAAAGACCNYSYKRRTRPRWFHVTVIIRFPFIIIEDRTGLASQAYPLVFARPRILIGGVLTHPRDDGEARSASSAVPTPLHSIVTAH